MPTNIEIEHPTLAANPLVGIRRRDVLDSARKLVGEMARNPRVAGRQYLTLMRELGRIATGRSELLPNENDRRFADTAWRESGPYRLLAQSYLAWGNALDEFVARAKMDKRDAQRARFVVSLFVNAMAPTNTLAGNPAALKHALDTGGASLLRGLENFVSDLAKNGGLPAQVDQRKFAVGKNLATTEGSVIFRNSVLELIQYRPLAQQVHKRPLLIVPPQINKYYAFDLSPEKSIVRFALQGGLQVFVASWKNPTPAEGDFGLDAYVEALEEAIDAMREITRSPDVNIWGACSGGITMSALLGHLASRKQRKIRSATLAVCLLDMATIEATTAGAFATPKAVAAAKRASRSKGMLEGRQLARMFAWMRSNDLVWNYWVNNYLMGNAPPAFDVLYWNSDTTRLPAKLHADFLDLIESDPFVNPGRLKVRGKPLDMRKVDLEAYVVAGTTDHITPWQGCYSSAKLFGARSRFVLANSGHIQTLINPPGNRKAEFHVRPAREKSAAQWLEKAAQHEGSWWPDWLAWIKKRSGALVISPAALGSLDHRPLCDAPGLYVMEK
ncbi:MAG TPA: alpha/beta fold hydrolase [Casimicrobiaceae bacterium]